VAIGNAQIGSELLKTRKIVALSDRYQM